MFNTIILVYRMALAGLVTVLHACLDMKSIILGKYHYMLFALVLAMQVGGNDSTCNSIYLCSCESNGEPHCLFTFLYVAKNAHDSR